ncbi:sigma-54-dependent transcriptional regulator [Kangiella sp. M94]
MSQNKPKVLIIDDEADIRHLLTMTLIQMGLDVSSSKDLTDAKKQLTEEPFHFCLTDLKLPDGNGLDFVKFVRKQYPHMPIAVITAFGSTDNAIEAMKLGAFDFLAKPIDLAHLRQLLKHAFKYVNGKQTEPQAPFTFLAGSSEAITKLREKMVKIRGSQAPIIIQGERGTEKERLAQILHEQSSRSDQTEVFLDCSSQSQEALEQLFFHKHEQQECLLYQANNSTLILSNIHMLSIITQKKLLHAIEQKKLPIESEHSDEPLDLRLIVCTEKALIDYVHTHQLRDDLYFRLNVIQIKVPSITQRLSDLDMLIDSYLDELSEGKKISTKARKILHNYEFPFNYRELENILEKACALSETDTIDVPDLLLAQSEELEPEKMRQNNTVTGLNRGDLPLDQFIEKIEKAEIEKALNETRWNRTEAAKLLGITFRTIRYKMKKLGIE